jgi:manganese/zinc/iron transport system permease protein
MTVAEFMQLDFGPLVLLVLAGVACALPGNFLLLKRVSLVGDTIAHAVLPGIVLAFLVTGAVATTATMLGAGLTALLAVMLVGIAALVARLAPGWALPRVASSFSPARAMLLELSGARAVHIDTEHALMGSVENALWLEATGVASLFDPDALARLPESVQRVAIVTLAAIAIVSLAFKEFRLAAFDPAYAGVAGLRPRFADALLLTLSAAAAVAAFDAVGAILTIALFVCPPATARLLTGSLRTQVLLSAVCAVLAGVAGYLAAALIPRWLGFEHAVNAGGAVALVSVLGLGAVAIATSRRGSTGATPNRA